MPAPVSQSVALVTGASRGIGRAIAERLAADGHAVVVNYHRNQAAADETVAAIIAAGGVAFAIQGDVSHGDDRERLVDQTLTHFGRLDVLVNNAGITSPGRRDLLEATEASWDEVLATNLKGPFFLAQRAAREMIRLIGENVISRGTLVSISSVSAYAVSTDRGDYCVAKAALEMMTKLFAVRTAEEKIRVYEIRPGIIASDMTAPVTAKYDKLIADGLSPIRRWGSPDDVARAVSAVVGDAFPFTTGQVIDVDGGFHLRRL